MRAMILAAGYGTRLKPLTDHIPKPLVKFQGTPMIEIIIQNLLQVGIESIIVNVHHMADQVISYLADKEYFGGRVLVSDERALLMDTGGGVLKAELLLNNGEPFMVHNVDVYTNLDLEKLIRTHQSDDALITIAVKKRIPSRSLLFDDQNLLVGLCDNRTGKRTLTRSHQGNAQDYGNSCIYIINPEFFSLVSSREPVSLTDLYLELSKNYIIRGYVHNQDYWYNLGLYDTFRKAEEDF